MPENLPLLAVVGPNRVAGKYNYAPTLIELGYNASVSAMRCVMGWKGMPIPVLEKVQQVFGEVAQSKEYKEFLSSQNSVSIWLFGDQALKAWDEQEIKFRPILEKAALLKGKK